MTSNKYVCKWCQAEFERRSMKGPPPQYCSAAHRQRSHEARRRRTSEEQVRALAQLVNRPALRAIQSAQDQWLNSPALRAIQSMQDQWLNSPALRAIQSVQDQLAAAIRPALQAMRPLVDARVVEALGTFDGPRRTAMALAAELLHQIYPPNWPEGVATSQMCELMAETGWSLTYVPRPEVISKLLEADPIDRESVLLSHTDEITVDCRACLAEVAEPEVTHLVVALTEALDAFDAGFAIPAQATVASVLTDVINRTFRLSFAQATERLAEDAGEMPLPYLRFWLVVSTIPRVLARFRDESGDEVPAHFNRHAVAHTVDPRQYTKLNALTGLMLASGLVREIAKYDAGDD